MKVFLLENVANLGQKGDIKEVNEGYARNFLIAKNLACLVQDKRAKAVLEEKQAHYKEQKIIKKELDLKAQSLQGKVFKFSAKADKNGRLFGSIGPKELAKETGLSENLFKEHFKQVGTFTLNIEISPENFVKIQIVIEKEK